MKFITESGLAENKHTKKVKGQEEHSLVRSNSFLPVRIPFLEGRKDVDSRTEERKDATINRLMGPTNRSII